MTHAPARELPPPSYRAVLFGHGRLDVMATATASPAKPRTSGVGPDARSPPSTVELAADIKELQ
ncbi:unnamed protein product [Cutaneotrichosporon oleaginosum]